MQREGADFETLLLASVGCSSATPPPAPFTTYQHALAAIDTNFRKRGDAPFQFGRADVNRLSARRRRPKALICWILEVARSTAYYREYDCIPIVDQVMTQRIKHLIDLDPYLGYRMV